MLDLISLHIPKTAGTSFYAILQQVYADQLSISYRRRDITPQLVDGQFPLKVLLNQVRVLHGHFYYPELTALQAETKAKLICWLRNPVDRVVSNYNFFQAGLGNPSRNSEQYELNKHRLGESLLAYAERQENRNRISQFLAGITPDKLFFCGRMSHFEQDIQTLAMRLNWPPVAIPKLNRSHQASTEQTLTMDILQQLQTWNADDIALCQELLHQKDRE